MNLIAKLGLFHVSLALAAGLGSAQATPGKVDDSGDKVVHDHAAGDGGVAGKYKASDPNAWFEKTQLDLGTYFNEEFATGKFHVKNPTDSEQKIANIVGSCTCSRAVIHVGDRTYTLDKEPVANSLHRVRTEGGKEVKERVSHITIGPKEEGEIEVFMEMHGVRGAKEATLDLSITDTETPHVKLSWKAVGAIYLEINPPDVNLGEMGWNDQREFTFEISSPIKEDFNIVRHDELPKGLKLESEKVQRAGRSVWVVRGTYGPGIDERANGATINFETDIDNKSVEARIVAFVKGPIEVDPSGFISLGYVPEGTAKSRSVSIRSTDEFDLQVTKIEYADLRVPDGGSDKFEVVTHKDGKDVKVELALHEGMPRGVIRGTLRVHLNHPASPVREFMFNGFVR